VGTWGGGLNRYEPKTDTFTHFNHDPANPESISNDSILSFQQDYQGQLWIGTEGGLNRMNSDGTFTSYRLKDGLPNENVMGILEDNRGNLWLSTGNGLARFDPVTETFKVFGTMAYKVTNSILARPSKIGQASCISEGYTGSTSSTPHKSGTTRRPRLSSFPRSAFLTNPCP
jgi:sugar lactone lactonase YvrE